MPAARTIVLDVREERRDAGGARWQLLVEIGADRRIPCLLEVLSRSGARLVLPVLATEQADEGQVWLVVDKPLAAGTAVHAITDAPNPEAG